MNHISEEQLILYYYGEADEADAIKTHLSFCPHCRSNYESFQRVLAVVDAVEVPARTENYSQEVWQRLKPRLGRPRGFLWSFLARPPRWAVAGAMAANHSGLQMDTVRNLLLAWVLTLPVCVLLGAALFAGSLYVFLTWQH